MREVLSRSTGTRFGGSSHEPAPSDPGSLDEASGTDGDFREGKDAEAYFFYRLRDWV